MVVVDRRVEKRPWLGVLQRYRGSRDQSTKLDIFAGGFVEAACCNSEINAPQSQHQVFEGGARQAAFLSSGGGNFSVSSRSSPLTVSAAREMISVSWAGIAVPSTLAKSMISASRGMTPSRS
jgi:hypothetical protein